MGTTFTLAYHQSDAESDLPWRLYDEIFETGVVYRELRGVGVELEALGPCGVNVTLRIPITTAEELGLSSKVAPSDLNRVRTGPKW